MGSCRVCVTLALTWLLLGCDQRQGTCVEAATPHLPEMCVGAQKNTCEKTPGNRWQAFRDEKAFDKTTDSCAALGFTARGPGGQTFVKPGAR